MKIFCYGPETRNRKDAIKFYRQAARECEGSEAERYWEVLDDLESGRSICWDKVTKLSKEELDAYNNQEVKEGLGLFGIGDVNVNLDASGQNNAVGFGGGHAKTESINITNNDSPGREDNRTVAPAEEKEEGGNDLPLNPELPGVGGGEEAPVEEAKCEEKKLDEDAVIFISLDDFEPWSGAVDTWDKIVDAGKLEELDFILEDVFPDGMNRTELNDLLWFESDWVLDQLGLNDEEPEEDEFDEDDFDLEDDEEEVELGLADLADLDEE